MAYDSLSYARTLLGLAEVPGPDNNPLIVGWLKALRAWWFEDATPWCGVFVAHVMQHIGKPLPKHWYRAKGWLEWGKACQPAIGCVVVLDRDGGGHVFLLTKVSSHFVWGIGGNQGDKVSEAKFDRLRVLGYRWPADEALPQPAPVLLSNAGGAVSRNEA